MKYSRWNRTIKSLADVIEHANEIKAAQDRMNAHDRDEADNELALIADMLHLMGKEIQFFPDSERNFKAHLMNLPA